MFGKPHCSTNPMAEVWIPDALKDKASFQGMLSYAASHLAQLRHEEHSTQAMVYKIQAIMSIQKQINNRSTALSDNTVSAILRQISVEVSAHTPFFPMIRSLIVNRTDLEALKWQACIEPA
jgi:hypothetical protein